MFEDCNRKVTTEVQNSAVHPENGKKSSGSMRLLQGRSMVYAGIVLMLIVVAAGVLAVIPSGMSLAFQASNSSVSPKSKDAPKQSYAPLIDGHAAIAAQTKSGRNHVSSAASMTGAQVTAPGEVPSSTQEAVSTQAPIAPAQASMSTQAPVVYTTVAGNADTSWRFSYGQCTSWANNYYHWLTGWWVPWLGNANEWVGGAVYNGWVTSSEPNPYGPSIIVLQPYTQGASAYGHVGVVGYGVSAASANAYGVSASNMNWNGGVGVVSYWTFHPGAGVTFIWHR